MADFPYLPIWVADFMGDTQHLTCQETGAYLLLLFAAWRSPECGLPDDDRKLARLARCSLWRWRRIRPTVLEFWTLGTDSLWHQKRLDHERKKVSVKSLKAIQSAQAMWLKRRERGPALAERTLSERYANHNQNRYESSSSENLTDAARDPARPGGSGPRAAQRETTTERVARLAFENRQKLMRKGGT